MERVKVKTKNEPQTKIDYSLLNNDFLFGYFNSIHWKILYLILII